MATQNLDLEKMSFEELLKLKESVDAAFESKVDARRQELMAELDKLGGFGARAQQKQAGGEGRKRGSPPAKYRSKKNPDLTWSGRGADPRWLTAEMAESGKGKETFLIAGE